MYTLYYTMLDTTATILHSGR